MSIFLLPANDDVFPPQEYAREDGLLALGGDLSVKRLLNAYSNGIFPWYNPGEIIQWWCPKERFVIFPNEIIISRSMKKILKKMRCGQPVKTELTVKFNSDFASVMHNCRTLREGQTWISDEMEEAYNNLFNLGYARSVEVYDETKLTGGLYGVAIGKCFFGESMFSKAANASKIALIRLCETLSAEGFLFIDCQFHTEHLERMGGRFISWDDYKKLLCGCAYRD